MDDCFCCIWKYINVNASVLISAPTQDYPRQAKERVMSIFFGRVGLKPLASTICSKTPNH